jgi:AcrR family transcriptional regulator
VKPPRRGPTRRPKAAPASAPKRAPRRRRSADEARREILDAAERRLQLSGPATIRLQDIAAEVGISHPAVLHHFGSREALVEAVVERAIHALERELIAMITVADGEWLDPATLLGRVADTLGARGQARLLAWLVLTGHRPFGSRESRQSWARIAESTHALRLRVAPRGGQPPPYEDTLFTVILSCLALFGEALAGEAVFDNAGLANDSTARPRFRDWLGGVLLRHMAG